MQKSQAHIPVEAEHVKLNAEGIWIKKMVESKKTPCKKIERPTCYLCFDLEVITVT